jgi:hypothetical protein
MFDHETNGGINTYVVNVNDIDMLNSYFNFTDDIIILLNSYSSFTDDIINLFLLFY